MLPPLSTTEGYRLRHKLHPSARAVRRSPARFAASRSALALVGGRAAVVAVQLDVVVGARLPAGSCVARRLLEWTVSLVVSLAVSRGRCKLRWPACCREGVAAASPAWRADEAGCRLL